MRAPLLAQSVTISLALSACSVFAPGPGQSGTDQASPAPHASLSMGAATTSLEALDADNKAHQVIERHGA